MLKFWRHKSASVGFILTSKENQDSNSLVYCTCGSSSSLKHSKALSSIQSSPFGLVHSIHSWKICWSLSSWLVLYGIPSSKMFPKIPEEFLQHVLRAPWKSPACQCFQFSKISPKAKTNAVAATTSNWVFRAQLLCSPSCIIHLLFPLVFFFFFSKKDGG